MPVAVHTFRTTAGDGSDPTKLQPSHWLANQLLAYTLRTKSSTNYTLETDVATGNLTVDSLLCSGTETITIPHAVGSGYECCIAMGAGTVAITFALDNGSDTLGGGAAGVGFISTAIGDSFTIKDVAPGVWALLGAKLGTATDTTPLALSAGGGSPFGSHVDHSHRSPGAVAAITSQVTVGNSSNAETTIMTATLPAGTLAVGTTFRFRFFGTSQFQATSGTLTFRMYVGANSLSVTLASRGILAQAYCGFEGMLTIRSVGASGTFIANGEWWAVTSATAMTQASQGAASTAVVDTTATTPIVKLTAQFQTSSATNILLVQTGTIEIVAL